RPHRVCPPPAPCHPGTCRNVRDPLVSSTIKDFVDPLGNPGGDRRPRTHVGLLLPQPVVGRVVHPTELGLLLVVDLKPCRGAVPVPGGPRRQGREGIRVDNHRLVRFRRRDQVVLILFIFRRRHVGFGQPGCCRVRRGLTHRRLPLQTVGGRPL